MIKLETERGNFEKLEIRGDVAEIAADLIHATKVIYRDMIKADELKEQFKTIMAENIGMAFTEKSNKLTRLLDVLEELDDAIKALGEDDDPVGHKA